MAEDKWKQDAEAEKETEASGQAEEKAGMNDVKAQQPEDAAAHAKEGETKEAEGEKQQAAKPDAKDKKIDELTDKYKRLFAEFDNFRKRSETEKAGMYAEGERAVLEKILPVVDNFERALSNVPDDLKDSAYVKGVEKIYRSFADVLKAIGVEPIDAKGKDFDANLHNAVMHIEDDNEGENVVVEELQKGYMFHDKVLRHSMVKVAN